MPNEVSNIQSPSKCSVGVIAASLLLAMTLVSLSSPRADVNFVLEKEKGEDKSTH